MKIHIISLFLYLTSMSYGQEEMNLKFSSETGSVRTVGHTWLTFIDSVDNTYRVVINNLVYEDYEDLLIEGKEYKVLLIKMPHPERLNNILHPNYAVYIVNDDGSIIDYFYKDGKFLKDIYYLISISE